MPHSVQPAARGHLRLASSPAQRRRLESKAFLLAGAALAAVALFLATLLALATTALALVTLLWRRAPLGVRLRPIRNREAQVLKFQPRQKALPR